MSFIRQNSDKWHREIPGARWFKGDLHVHTVDDFAGGRAKLPEGISGDVKEPEVLKNYARAFLHKAAEKKIQILGLTPHSPRTGTGLETSAVWHIVQTWNDGTDTDGTPFRDKIFAVFPGFEISLNKGRSGLHLQFLFDPEIGLDSYLKLFDVIMDAVNPWLMNNLQTSQTTPERAFKILDKNSKDSVTQELLWDYIVLAPHIEADKGLLDAMKGDVLSFFEHQHISAYELGKNKTPSDALKNRGWLQKSMCLYRQAFIQGSDAYTVDDIGNRHTWFKLARPRIMSLKQAMIANEAKIRLGFNRVQNEETLSATPDPDENLYKKPWLRKVSVAGRASFFGREDGKETEFEFSPDFTCIIGGSMTGKSTLLDGLRCFGESAMPKDDNVSKQVQDRGWKSFLAASAEVGFDCPGRESTAPFKEQWPAVFFAQNELQSLAEGSSEVEEMLAQLAPQETQIIAGYRQILQGLDDLLGVSADQLTDLDEKIGEASQSLERARKARDELSAFAAAGYDKLLDAGRDYNLLEKFVNTLGSIYDELDDIRSLLGLVNKPKLRCRALLEEINFQKEFKSGEVDAELNKIRVQISSVATEFSVFYTKLHSILTHVHNFRSSLQVSVERELAESGVKAGALQTFQALSRQASLLSSFEAVTKEFVDKNRSLEILFFENIEKIKNITRQKREAYDRVIAHIENNLQSRIRVECVISGDKKPLDDFVGQLANSGITRWWNTLANDRKPDPETILELLERDSLAEVEMSDRVQTIFRELMTRSRKLKLAAIRCPDQYILSWLMDDGEYRNLDKLSGGQRINVLLTLLLETSDDRPLVIDQPEDEIDSRHLFDTILPSLRKLKGRRQVIVATHNANIVVNGDADMVIKLDATSNHGHVSCSGAIEEPAMRDTIVRTVDGGEEAFRLRKKKYGF